MSLIKDSPELTVTPPKVDLDRGVLMSKTFTGEFAGMKVYMYVDTPGVYINEHGTRVPDAMAAACGQDVSRWKTEKVRREKMSKAREAIEEELRVRENNEPITVAEMNGFRLVDIGMGRHKVVDPHGNAFSDKILTEKEGMMWLKMVAEPELEGEPVEPQAPRKPGIRRGSEE